MPNVVVTGGFDNPLSREVRFLQEAARSGRLKLLLWSDDAIRQQTGQDPKLSLAERQYFFGSIRYVDEVAVTDAPVDPDALSTTDGCDVWVMHEEEGTEAKRAFCEAQGLTYRVIKART